MAAARNRSNITPRRRGDTDDNALPPNLARRTLRGAQAHRFATAAGGAVILAGATVAGIALWPSTPQRYEPPVTAREYSSFTTCLLTDSQGITSATAAPVWAAMETASRATTEQTRYLSVNGPDTLTNTETYLNTLALGSCNVIVTAGAQPNAAAHARASAFPGISFILVGASTKQPDNARNTQTTQLAGALEASYRARKAS